MVLLFGRILLLLGLLAGVWPSNSQASSPLVDCNSAAVSAAINTGGIININCSSPTVLIFSNELVLNQHTEINGNNNAIFDGQNTRRLLRSANHLNITLRNLTIRNGHTSDQGAGLKIGFWNTLTISNLRFENNQATKDSEACDGGGAIFIGGGSRATIDQSVFINNRANNGGAINSLRTNLVVSNSNFEQNSAMHTTAINQYGDCGGGGAIYIDGTRLPADGGPDGIMLQNNSYTSNTSNNHGGAIFIGLYSNETATIERSSFTNNSVTYAPSADWSGTGGAIWYGFAATGVSNERLIINNSTLEGNKAIGQGGGLWVDAPATIRNTTFYANDATDPRSYPDAEEWKKGNGGALAVNNNAAVDITNATFAQNHAGFNGGAIAGQTITIRNTLFAHNSTDWDIKIMQHCTNALIDGSNNMQYPPKNPNPNFWNETNCTRGIRTPELSLVGLANNGGATKTAALPAGSPAINAGNPATCIGLDQRGYTRAGTCDIGAFEYNGAPFSPSHTIYLPLARKPN
ncbi:choice-of-anchor Q domain-containing protein [Herpetosiphon giganteus]|uniref:choice-of-anchor Q domain-containing protein n=1 Tax=Herpetosiphon giganteus TaxID=2029754 RepID=UPI00195867B6|nr:choice-of-anchor Q domain-containing protein [Herpetosiphon giganteus]MBM7841398.1 putative outer membrane repeat protein [Herpetosiphon giganteus]